MTMRLKTSQQGPARRDLLVGAAALGGATLSVSACAGPKAPTLDLALAERFARLALSHIEQEYPVSPGLSRMGPDDPLSPKINHPVFWGSFDWASSVANHWMLARLLRTYPQLPQAEAIAARFDRAFSEDAVAAELAFMAKPNRQGFGRPVGWGYIMMMAAEFAAMNTDQATRWRSLLQPMVADFTTRIEAFMPKLRFAGRAGGLPFGLSLMVEGARGLGDEELGALVAGHAKRWFDDAVIDPGVTVGGAESFPAEWAQADLMRRVLAPDEFEAWFSRFAPQTAKGEPKILLQPFVMKDRSDRRLNLANDTMNLSRSWLLGTLSTATAGRAQRVLKQAAAAHLEAAFSHIEDDEFTIRSFPPLAVLALQKV